MLGFEIVIYWSNEDRALIAEAPELPGCTAHSDDRDPQYLVRASDDGPLVDAPHFGSLVSSR